MAEAVDAVDPPSADGSPRDRSFVAEHPVVVAVLTITAIGLLARFAILGSRIAHWDEARVAYWVDYTFETGRFAYNSHTHGPVIQHLSRYLFGILGPSDTTIRIPVAIIGGLLPVSALLYREHLRDVEVVILSGLLSANAVLLYYSRFMRSDLLVATFMFTAFGLLVRFYDTRRIRYLYAATICIVLGIGSKENAPLYVLTWLGAGAILLDVALYRPRNYRGGLGLIATKFAHLKGRLGDIRHRQQYATHTIGIAVVAIALFTFLFATRGGGIDGIYQPPEGLSFWAAITSPWRILNLVSDTLTYVIYPNGEYFAFTKMDAVLIDLPGPPAVDATASGSDPKTVPYLSRLFAMGGGLLAKAPVVLGFGLVGVLYERYLAERSRTLVLFMFFAALFSLVGYPLTLSIDTGWKWNMVHVVVPLSIPAAVGLGIVGRWATVAYRRHDRVDLGLSAVVLLLVTLLVAWVAVPGAYPPADRSGDNPLVQYGQPADDLRPTLDQLQTAAVTHAGTDVIVYDGSRSGEPFVRGDSETASKDFRPTCTKWDNTLPLNWYLAAYDADTECVADSDGLIERIETEDPPPIVITRESDATVPEDALEADYQPRTYRLRTHGSEATIYVHEDVSAE
ncbi:dolichyl-phosphate-mannose-proteinmannosyltransf erase [Halorhabdus utahensis DSM 12940]|uniref:Dolichyl-phosphate-mannose-proteinmannosyltransf erase n=1 Tax=Halorhabdus utahensis (strain DSM 12940 / JCM 11049 / AX-2) TaxID=519442 RepID=C7NTQ6_HALUD|nr:flippase activity-associated protein Agl23 [Halorhabdus utahensis]ACV10895.1 dolichyl-phosphate-mannose-proteinmannosyltransf erase [Halorhabdus utahensis DSM 12940]